MPTTPTTPTNINQVPRPSVMTIEGRVRYATEIAFENFVSTLKQLGVEVNPVMGFVYLPNDVKRPFQLACNGVYRYLTPDEPTTGGVAA